MSSQHSYKWFGRVGHRAETKRHPGCRTIAPTWRRLRTEPLENRLLLANVSVNNFNDVVNGNVASIAALVAGDGGDGISLREAIQAANADAAADTIDFAIPGGLIQLTNVGHVGEIAITNSLTINGPGAREFTIRAFAGTSAVGDGARIFKIDDGNFVADKSVAISGLRLNGGDSTASGNFSGGAIHSWENLTLTACTISGNRVTNGPGGGVWQLYGALTFNACTISGNMAIRGGGISGFNTNVIVSDSTIAVNTATFTTGVGGGGIGTLVGGSLTVSNSTISGNQANGNGGGIFHYSGNLTIRHSTITGNLADADNNGAGRGGGVYVRNIGTTASLDHTIVAGNLHSVAARDDVFGAATARYSLIGDKTGATITNIGGNQIGTGASPIDPLLSSLTDNAGPTFTHALLVGSPAIDTGDPAAIAGVGSVPLNDQRGALFARVLDGDNAGVARIDIGAYESVASVGSFPGVPDVEDQFQALKHHGEAIGWILPENLGAPDPSLLDHYQGIARYPGPGTPIFYITQKGGDAVPFTGGFLDVVRLESRDTDGERLRSNLQVNVQSGILGNTEHTLPPAEDTWIRAIAFDGSSLTIDDHTLGAYEHPGGMAIIDNILFVPMDTPSGSGLSEGVIVLFDLGLNGEWRESPIPIQVLELNHKIDNITVVKRSEQGPGTEESYLIWVNGDGGAITRFYKTMVGNPGSSENHLRNDSLNLQLVQDWDPDSPDDFEPGGSLFWMTGRFAHQSSTFIQQADGSTPSPGAPLYLIGLRHSGPFGIPTEGSDFADLYRVTDNGLGGYKLTHVQTLHMFAEYDGAGRIGNFAAGNNAYVSPSGELLLYSVQHDDEDGADPDYVKMEEFRHREVNRDDSPLRMAVADAGGPYFVPEGHTVQLHGRGTPRVDRPWVELFDDTFGWLHAFEHPDDHEGDRSIVVDYVDRALLELNNFNFLDGFGDKTSSVQWRLPVGLNVELFDDHEFEDTKLLLTGTGQTESLSDLDDFGFGDKTSSMRFVGVEPGASALTLEWDLDADGIFGETGASASRGDETTANPTFSAAGLVSPSIFNVGLRVRDDAGLSIVSTATIHITNPVLTVTSLADAPVDLSDTTVTLRDAIHAANNDLQVSPGGAIGSGADEIRFQPGLSGTIVLNQGQLPITSDMTILGPGASLLTVSGNNASRVFDVSDSTTNIKTVVLSGITITTGNALASDGGGISNRENLTIDGVTLSGNSAASQGGGIFNLGTLTVQNSTVSGNAAVGDGGGILNTGIMTVDNSSVTENQAANTSSGGGLFNGDSASATITGSTFAGNEANLGGGLRGGGTLNVINSTISGNRARESGGGVVVVNGTAVISHVTAANNRADSDAIGGGSGGGLHRINGDVTLHHTIVADNFLGAGIVENDVTGAVNLSSSFNLIGTGGSGGLLDGATGNLVGVDNPRLAPLADNGGPTETHALQSGSPAIDAGDPGIASPPAYDQRGAPFDRVTGGRLDIGAYEADSIPPIPGDGNLDGSVNGLDYLLWAANFGDNPADDPPGSPMNGDYNDDGKVDGLDYLVWASHFGQGAAVVASVPAAQTFDSITSAPSSEELAAVDLALEDDYDTGATVADDLAGQSWRTSSAFDSALEKLSGRRRDHKRIRAAI